MNVGFHFLEDSCPDVYPAAAFLDVAGAGAGMKSAERLSRVFFKGRPQPAEVAQKALAWGKQGCRVQVGNEPNLADEGFGGTPVDFARWFQAVRDLAPGVRLYWPGMSPGVPGWQEWAEQALYVQADGLCVHAYGTFDQMRDVAAFYLDTFPGKPLWFGEVNFGAGQQVDRDRWASDHLLPFLNWCAAVDQIEAVTYFAYRWPAPDMKLPTPVDAQGTEIERVIRAWRAPQPKEQPVSTLRIVDLSNYQGIVDMSGWKAAGIDGAVVRVSEDGSPLDPFAPATVKQLRDRGLLVGLYHLTDPRYASPVQSLDNFRQGIANVGGMQPGDVPVNDAEQGVDGDNAPWQAQWGRGFADSEGFKSLFYSAPWWMDPHNLSIEGVAREYSGLWEAKYTGDPLTRPDDLPGWVEVMVQYTASGTVPGVNGNVDISTFFGTREDWLKLGRPGAPVTPPQPTKPDARAALAKVKAAVAELEAALA